MHIQCAVDKHISWCVHRRYTVHLQAHEESATPHPTPAKKLLNLCKSHMPTTTVHCINRCYFQCESQQKVNQVKVCTPSRLLHMVQYSQQYPATCILSEYLLMQPSYWRWPLVVYQLLRNKHLWIFFPILIYGTVILTCHICNYSTSTHHSQTLLLPQQMLNVRSKTIRNKTTTLKFAHS